MKIAIVGNCQGRAMERIINMGRPDSVMYWLPANYVAREENRAEFDAAYADCDFILVQNVSETFDIEFVRPDYARASGKPTLVWPVVYFNGYFPDIGYLRSDAGVVEGPLGGYHSHYVRDRYLRGWDLSVVQSGYMGYDYVEMYRGAFARSVDEITQREIRCDLFASSYIRERAAHERLFLTPNHPINEMIIEIINQAGRAFNLDFAIPRSEAEQLDEITLPINRNLLLTEGASFAASESFFVRSATDHMQEISACEMVERFFHLYDTLPIETVRHGIAC